MIVLPKPLFEAVSAGARAAEQTIKLGQARAEICLKI